MPCDCNRAGLECELMKMFAFIMVMCGNVPQILFWNSSLVVQKGERVCSAPSLVGLFMGAKIASLRCHDVAH